MFWLGFACLHSARETRRINCPTRATGRASPGARRQETGSADLVAAELWQLNTIAPPGREKRHPKRGQADLDRSNFGLPAYAIGSWSCVSL